MSLKERLLNNPRGTCSIPEYLQQMCAIADDLALVDNPLSEDDLVLYILSGIGPEFKEIAAALRARDTPISFDELYDKLGDYELHLKKDDHTPSLSIATANYTHRHNRTSPQSQSPYGNTKTGRQPGYLPPRGNTSLLGRPPNQQPSHNNGSHTVSRQINQSRTPTPRSSLYCRFCDRPGHATNECRKLARFLRENDVQTMHSVHSPQFTTPTTNATTFHRNTSSPWLFDTGASHHVTSDPATLLSYSDYGGPDEIHISDGSVYVDDIILTGNNTTFLDSFVNTVDHRFSLKDLGPLHHFLSVEVINTTDGLFLSQHRHIHDLLHTFLMTCAKEVNTPMCNTSTLTLQDGSSLVDPTPYRKLVRALQYLSLTRPDVCFAVNRLSQFMNSPTELHWTALKRVLRYLKAIIHHGLYLRRRVPLTLHAFIDSDWGGDRDNGRTTTGYILYLGSNPISWKSSRQKSVSRSSSEAEYKAIANSTVEIMWVTILLYELGLNLPRPPALFCDNTGATYLCANLVFHSRMKHIALDYHFVGECVTNGTLRVHHVNSKDQLADILTKAIPRQQFHQLLSKIGVTNGASILRGRVKKR
ncbi:hypothetical protein RJ640_028679 [Escallonia rubra]|uniref:Reverse transcriptase Ty1/copia-type domain-containing protein n=1 Tax=Escallonia rubra TaxID=112253 RepID=A0AA88RA26_9ASTE|nr:hypothetical protein RJ640_028679 [Escallonia rubra]